MKLLLIFFIIFQTDTLKKKEKPYEIGEEVITGEKRIIINEMKILKIPQIDPFSLITEKFAPKETELNKEIIKYLDSIYLSFPLLSFPYLRIPIKEKKLRKNFLIFLPEFEKGIKDWSLTIYSQKGEIVKKITGKGEPPKAIYWDLRKEDKTYLNVDEIYYGIFTASDFLGNETKLTTQTFYFDGLIYQEKDKKVILINPEKIFEIDNPEITEEGKLIIEEVCNLIKKEMPKEIILSIFLREESYLLEKIRNLEEEITKRIPIKKPLKTYPQFQKGIFEKINKIEISLIKS